MLGEHKLIHCRDVNWVDLLVQYVFKFWTCEVKWTFEVSVNTEMDTRQWSFREQA